MSEKNALLTFSIQQALNYENAVVKILEISNQGCMDTVILEINLGKSKNNEGKSGEDILIREHAPKAKIIVFPSHHDKSRINSIRQNINPEGFFDKRWYDQS